MVEPCLFCDEPSGSSEHAWPDWICRYAFDNAGHWVSQKTQVGSDLVTVENIGQEIDIVTDAVGDTCNHGWMHRLEDRVSRFLKPMIDGNAVTLTMGDRKAL